MGAPTEQHGFWAAAATLLVATSGLLFKQMRVGYRKLRAEERDEYQKHVAIHADMNATLERLVERTEECFGASDKRMDRLEITVEHVKDSVGKIQIDVAVLKAKGE